jgi:hypothetical protein
VTLETDREERRGLVGHPIELVLESKGTRSSLRNPFCKIGSGHL